MRVFLDFEASSLDRKSHPIEVAWVFEDGNSESHLIRPAPNWTDWSEAAQAVHHIDRETLVREGHSHEEVARRMVAVLTGHDLLASAPSWDGKWLSTLLRAAGLPRHALRLRDSDVALRESTATILAPVIPAERLDAEVESLLTLTEARTVAKTPAHRALPDAQAEHRLWLAACEAARAKIAGLRAFGSGRD